MDKAAALPHLLAGFRVHMVGIKGTGMAALAEILAARGARVTGSDTPETFYTDAVLRRLEIPFREGFAETNLPVDAQLVVHSAAYRRDENPELLAAARLRIPMALYPEALGLLSGTCDASGVSGVHGKSTTTALAGTILKAWKFPATVLVGTEVPGFGGRSTLVQGDRYLVAETCEYRRHFLNFHPERIIITSIEPDHMDYFRDLEDILCAFEAYGRTLPFQGTVIYCADDAGASAAAARIFARRDDLVMLPYGRSAAGSFRITSEELGEGVSRFRLAGLEGSFALRIPGSHSVLNAAAALALSASLWQKEHGSAAGMDLAGAAVALEGFAGSRRRSEILGEAGGVLFMDDYAHHPTAVEKTLAGIKAFHPGRRLVVDFMSHTYSRTRALLPEFGRCFGPADLVVLHRIYPSAREADSGSGLSEELYREVSRHHPRVQYFDEPSSAVPWLKGELSRGDLFVTMGAGDNWKVGRELFAALGGGA
jgi:UDP-N-acetylmuramate--alanine ligase